MKKLLLFFGLICVINLTVAQETVTIHQNGHDFQVSAVRSVTDYPADSIQYWVGSGSNSVVAVFKWCQNATMGIAYGYRWDGSATIYDLLTDIAAADSRFTVTFSGSMINTYAYQDDTYNEYLGTPGYLMYTLNGNYCSGYSDALVNNGFLEMEEWGSCYPFPATTPIVPASDPNAGPEPFVSPFAPENITFWIGEGTNSATAIFYWCQDIPAGLAYGFRWNGTATVGDMLNAIDSIDTRLSIDMSGGWINNYVYQDGNYNQHIAQAGYLMYAINGDWDAFISMTDNLNGGDVFQMQEWGNCEMPAAVYPVPDLFAPDTLFDGMAETGGSQAIHYQDEAILGWATGCTVERGPQDIANNTTMLASHGTEADAVGASSMNTGECVSLGDGGMATLTFGMPIQNGDGYDFAVFENSLNGYFLELAFVEVSSDGEHFVRFPAASNTQTLTQIGNADTVEAARIHNLAGKYLIGWGTPFDLAELAGAENLDINNVTHVRVVDVVGSINPIYATRDRYGRLINDPYPTNFQSSGFDLSGVAVMNGWRPTGIANRETARIIAYPNPCSDNLYITLDELQSVELYNVSGQLLEVMQPTDLNVHINMQSYPAGLYMLKVGNGVQKILKK